jgi:hypothetical protein
MKARKLTLAALTACLAISLVAVPTASAAKKKSPSATQAQSPSNKQLQRRVNQTNRSLRHANAYIKSLVAAVNGERTKSAGQDAQLGTIFNNVLPAATAALTQLGDGLLALKAGLEQAGAGLTQLSAAVQGPNIGGQLGAAGSAAPGTGNAATPTSLPTGTVYRRIIVFDATDLGLPTSHALHGAPLGVQTWVKMPDVASLSLANTYGCTGFGAAGTGIPTIVGAAGITGITLNCNASKGYTIVP